MVKAEAGPLKYSLRSLMIVAILAPPLLALVIVSLPSIVERLICAQAHSDAGSKAGKNTHARQFTFNRRL